MHDLPSTFSEFEKCQALALLGEAQSATRTYKGDFTATWLLSPIYAPVWKISKGRETRLVNGELKNFYEYNWSAALFDKTRLTDQCNAQVLHSMQRLAFLARENPGGPKTLATFKNFLWSLNFFIRWVYLNGDILNPRKHFLTKLTKSHFSDLFLDLAKGGTVFALRYPERFLQEIFPKALSRNPTIEELNNPLSLRSEDCRLVTAWIRKNNGLQRVSRSSSGGMILKTKFLADLIHVDVDTVRGGPQWTAFLGQFAISDMPHEKRLAHLNASAHREFPSQKNVSINDAKLIGVSEKTLGKYFDDLKTIVSLHRHLPNVCPDPLQFKPHCIQKIIVGASKVSNRTPWIPLHIAMNYTTEALRWVHVYGDDLVTLYLMAYGALYERGLLVSAPTPEIEEPTGSDYVAAARETSLAREEHVAVMAVPESLAALNLSGWGVYVHLNGKKGFAKLQKAPSLNDAIMVLIGAIVVLIATVKPIRESELRSLKTDCLHFADGDGFWLSHEARKKNVGDERVVDVRPIPVIAARAIRTLRRLTDGLKTITGVCDPWLLDSLMTLPTFGRYEAKIEGTIGANQLGMLIDAFCDYVAMPPDDCGRRWYLRIHEMRKSFLITFFWTWRYSGLDAARWMAGHADVSHIYAYIQANFPGEELPNLEAQYAAQVLREYEDFRLVPGLRNVDDLYQEVCSHFAVRDVSWIDEEMLLSWLELQFGSQEFQITPYSIRGPKGVLTTEIAFKIISRGSAGVK